MVERGAWVPMGELEPSETLLLAEGAGEAVVVAAEVELAPPGESFTTFNFEVAEWHTYFVRSGTSQRGPPVWVHNKGKLCPNGRKQYTAHYKNLPEGQRKKWLQEEVAAGRIDGGDAAKIKRRAELDAKFGRSGNLDADINARTKAKELGADVSGRLGRHGADTLKFDGDRVYALYDKTSGGNKRRWHRVNREFSRSNHVHQHHLGPQQFRAWFRGPGRGINVDDYTVDLPRRFHLSGVHGKGGMLAPDGRTMAPGRFNRNWARFMAKNPNATKFQTLRQMAKMKRAYGLQGLKHHKYR